MDKAGRRERAMTEGEPYRLITAFALPILFGSLFQRFYSMADAFIVSRFLGVDPFAGVSCTSGLCNIVIGFANGMTAGFAIPIAQCFGAGDHEGMRAHYRQDLRLCVFMGVFLVAAGAGLASGLLKVMNTPLEIFHYAVSYLRIMYLGIPVSILYNYFANILRALGDSRSPVTYLMISSVVNIVLDYLLIRFTSLGVRGAALATILAQTVSVLMCLRRICQGKSILKEKNERHIWNTKRVRADLALGLPMAFQSSILSFGVVLVQRATNGMGTMTIAAYSAAQKIDGIAVEPLRSFGLAMTTYAAQNYGAKKIQRIRTGLKQCVWITTGLSLVLGLVMLFGGRAFAAAFVGWGQKEILDKAQLFLRIHGLLYIILALLFDYRYTLQGLGSTKAVMAGSLMELAMRALSAFFLVPTLGFFGAGIETPLSWLGALIPVMIIWIKKNRELKET